MKIKISKSQWEEMGRKANWMDKPKASLQKIIDKLNSILPESQVEITMKDDSADWLRNTANKMGFKILNEVKNNNTTKFTLKKPFITKII